MDIQSLTRKWLQWFCKSSGSITAEAAISISMIVVAGLFMVQALGLTVQFHRLQALAQESSRTAAALSDPLLLENEVTEFVRTLDPSILVSFQWQEDLVTVKLKQPTYGVSNFFISALSAQATAPRWSG